MARQARPWFSWPGLGNLPGLSGRGRAPVLGLDSHAWLSLEPLPGLARIRATVLALVLLLVMEDDNALLCLCVPPGVLVTTVVGFHGSCNG